MFDALPADLVRDLAEPVLGQLGLDLLEVSWQGGRGRAVLRVTVDREGGVTVDECGLASEAIARVLQDREEQLSEPYSLEVSSPGAERWLRSEADFQAALGHRVRLTLQEGEARTVVEGRLSGLGPTSLQLEVRRQRSGRRAALEVDRRQLLEARVVVDL